MTRVLVLGAGAVGGLLAARLHVAGHEVVCTARQATIDAMDGFGISGLTEFHDGSFIDHFTTAPEGPFDAVFVATKATATADVAALAGQMAGSDGVVATLQNGLGNAQKLARHVDANRVAVCLTSHGVTRMAPGRLVHAGSGPTTCGPFLPEGEAAARRAFGLLSDAELEPQWGADMRSAVWTKAIVNAAINPVGALYGKTNGDVYADLALRRLSGALAQEGVALARRARVAVPDMGEHVLTVLQATAANKCSMLQDVEAKRPTEVEQILGRMVRLNERLLGHMPKMESVYGRIKDLEATYLGPEAAKQTAWDELEYEAEPF